MEDSSIFDDLLEEPEPLFDENNHNISQPQNELSLEQPEEDDDDGMAADQNEERQAAALHFNDGTEEQKDGDNAVERDVQEDGEEAEEDDQEEEEGELEQEEEEGEEEQQEEVEEEGEEEIEEQVVDQSHKPRLQQQEAKKEHGLLSEDGNSSGDDDKSSSNQENDSELPRKRRGRPSKKDKERDMQRQQTKLQKRVRFENGGEKVIYKSDAESDDAQNGFGVKSGVDQPGGVEDPDSRKNPGDFDEYVKMMNNEHISTNFETFTFKRRKQVYENLNDEEQTRFTAFIEACSKKPMKKKLLDLIAQLPGQKLKIDEVATQVINSAVKSHAGQLIELAKKIQIDEIKQKLAFKYPHRALQKDGKGPIIEEKRFLINGQCLSRQAQEALGQEIREMGPILPHHLQEARRQLNQSSAGVSDRPKSMFLHKRFR